MGSDRAVENKLGRGLKGLKVKKTCGWNNWRLNTPDKKVWLKKWMLDFGSKES